MIPDFSTSDQLMARLDNAVTALDDEYYKTRFVGYVAVSAVTAFEVNIRDKVIDFSSRKHNVFGNFTSAVFEKTNAKVKLEMLRNDFLSRFGERYLKRFNKALDTIEKDQMVAGSGSVKNAYANIINWRHVFVHQGELPQYASYEEARSAYEHGKLVIACFCDALHR